MDRRAFSLVLVAMCGCRPNDAGRGTTPSGAAGASSVANPRPVPAGESGAKWPRVSILVFGPKGTATAAVSGAVPVMTLFRARMTELGYRDGVNIEIDESYADGDPQRLNELAQAIVARRPDVIVAIAAAATAAVREATDTIPIVMAHAGNPVGSGLVASLAHPGGNVTGTTSMAPELGSKQVELLRQLVPGLKTLGVIANPKNIGTAPLLANVRSAADQFKVGIVVAEVTRAEDFDQAWSLLDGARPQALLVMVEPMIFLNRQKILAFASARRLPASYDVGREVVRQGGLVSYGPVLSSHYALVADYVDKILRGARPGDLAVQQPTEFALVINLNTAKALGLAVPQSLLVQADEVIR